jgi:hypothetical protein
MDYDLISVEHIHRLANHVLDVLDLLLASDAKHEGPSMHSRLLFAQSTIPLSISDTHVSEAEITISDVLTNFSWGFKAGAM